MIHQVFDTFPPDRVRNTAILSDDLKYRYSLGREWTGRLPRVAWVMLNPSTATADVDDPTIRKCMRYARDWGYGGIVVVNLFGYRSTDPRALKALRPHEAIGPENDKYLFSTLSTVVEGDGIILAAWGQHGKLNGRAAAVWSRAQAEGYKLQALKLAKDGTPYHPLYLKGDLKPFPLDGVIG